MSMSDLFSRRAAGRYVNDFYETEYIDDNEQLHRDDGPAYIDAEGNKGWYQHGKPHRDGLLPAFEYKDGRKEYWEHGVQLTPDEVQAKITARETAQRIDAAREMAEKMDNGVSHPVTAMKKIQVRAKGPGTLQ